MKKVLIIAVIIVLIAAGAVVFLYRDKLGLFQGSAFQKFQEQNSQTLPGEEPIVLPRE